MYPSLHTPPSTSRCMYSTSGTTGFARPAARLFGRQSTVSSVSTISAISRQFCTSVQNFADKEKDKRRRNSNKQSEPALRNIAGIGKAAESKLKEYGITTVESLKDKLKTESSGDTGKAVKFLKDTIGIRHKNHCESIVKTLMAPVEPLTFCVEGNIGAGKSTFLQYVRANNDYLNKQMQVVPEPVDQWQKVEKVPGGTVDQQYFNMLEEFYKDSQNRAYMFQNYVFFTRCLQEQNSKNGNLAYRLIERSIFSDRMVFVRAMQQQGLMDELHTAAYDNIFYPLVNMWRSLVPKGFIYLQASPETCLRRMQRRSRSEEAGVPKDYLEVLHGYHEDWLNMLQPELPAVGAGGNGTPPAASGSHRSSTNGYPLNGVGGFAQNGSIYTSQGSSLLQSVNGTIPGHLQGNQAGHHHSILLNPNGSTALIPELNSVGADTTRRHRTEPPEIIRKNVRWIQANTPVDLISSVLQEVPVLVLDMDDDIDLERDLSAKAELSTKVEAYFDWVQRGLPSHERHSEGGLLLPPQRKLAMPYA